MLREDPTKRLKLTVAHTHPWLKGHNHEEYVAKVTGRAPSGSESGADGDTGNGNEDAGASGSGVGGDASMQSAAPDASMEDLSQSEPEPMPGAYHNGDSAQGEPARLHRRRDIIISAQEEPQAGPSIPEPSQEMMESAHAEEQRYYDTSSRPNKRKGGPFEGSLTPMPEDPAEDTTNGMKDLSMADVASNAARSPSPAATRAKKAKAAAPGTSPSPPKMQKGRGKQPQVEDEAGSPAPSGGVERPRRSARLNEQSPQKARKAGRR